VKEHDLGKLPLVRVTAARVEERLREMEREGLGPNSINHLRRVLLGIFRRATKAGLWFGPNPIDAVDTRREHERAYVTLKPHEVPVFLENVPDQWRDVFATALYLGLRKGELFALKKSDIDLRTMTATIQRSYLRPTTKGGHVDTLPIPPQVVPYLEHAIAASGSEYMFPGPDGGMRSKDNDMSRLTQVVCKHAGLVEGYDHVCRRCKANGAYSASAPRPSQTTSTTSRLRRARTAATAPATASSRSTPPESSASHSGGDGVTF
jgi:integrase